nr:MAG TPA: hypothetical protein [Caudoviricetes sp.]
MAEHFSRYAMASSPRQIVHQCSFIPWILTIVL